MPSGQGLTVNWVTSGAALDCVARWTVALVGPLGRDFVWAVELNACVHALMHATMKSLLCMRDMIQLACLHAPMRAATDVAFL